MERPELWHAFPIAMRLGFGTGNFHMKHHTSIICMEDILLIDRHRECAEYPQESSCQRC